MINDPRFYLQLIATATGKPCGWIFTDQQPFVWQHYAHPSMLFAEAYPLDRVEKVRTYVQSALGEVVRVVPVECKMPVELERLLSA